MCLAIPALVERIVDEQTAVVDVGGVQREISTALVDDVAVGDYVILHVGFALNKIDPEEAKKTLDLFAQIEASAEATGEPT